MNREECLTRLVEAFKEDSVTYKDLKTPEGNEAKQQLLRSLMNIRMPKKIDAETLKLQDEYLTERNRDRGIVSIEDIPLVRKKISLWQGDITRLSVDAIVNAANSQMLGCFIPMHSCIDNCIHTYAGIELRQECYEKMEALKKKYGPDYEQPVGEPMLTKGYNLPCKRVIHVVGPMVTGFLNKGLEEDLRRCYVNILDLCKENGIRSVAFCCISTGVFRFPKDEAARIAVSTVRETLKHSRIEKVVFCVHGDENLRIYQSLLY